MAKRTPTIEDVLRARIRELRIERDWTQQRLAEAVTKAGVAMHQTTIAKIEGAGAGQKPRDVTVTEALAIAVALDVAPVHLLVPLDNDQRVGVTSKVVDAAGHVRAWVRGERPLDKHTDADLYGKYTARAHWFRTHGHEVAAPALLEEHRTALAEYQEALKAEEEAREAFSAVRDSASKAEIEAADSTLAEAWQRRRDAEAAVAEIGERIDKMARELEAAERGF